MALADCESTGMLGMVMGRRREKESNGRRSRICVAVDANLWIMHRPVPDCQLSLPDDLLGARLAARNSDDEADDERMQIESAVEPMAKSAK